MAYDRPVPTCALLGAMSSFAAVGEYFKNLSMHGVHRKISEEKQNLANAIWESHMKESRDKLSDDLMRHLDIPIVCVCKEIEIAQIMCYKSALKYKPEWAIEPTGVFGYCHICRDFANLKWQAKEYALKLSKRYCDEGVVEINIQNWASGQHSFQLTASEEFWVQKKLKALAELQNHVDDKDRVWKQFLARCEECMNASSNCALILLDYKSKTLLNRGPSSDETDFHNKRFASHCGFCVFMPGLKFHLDVLSATVSQTGYDSHLAMEKLEKVLKSHEQTKDIWKNITELEVWTDTGRHFVCGTFTGCVLSTLPYSKVALNSFVPHHGRTKKAHVGTCRS